MLVCDGVLIRYMTSRCLSAVWISPTLIDAEQWHRLISLTAPMSSFFPFLSGFSALQCLSEASSSHLIDMINDRSRYDVSSCAFAAEKKKLKFQHKSLKKEKKRDLMSLMMMIWASRLIWRMTIYVTREALKWWRIFVGNFLLEWAQIFHDSLDFFFRYFAPFFPFCLYISGNNVGYRIFFSIRSLSGGRIKWNLVGCLLSDRLGYIMKCTHQRLKHCIETFQQG